MARLFGILGRREASKRRSQENRSRLCRLGVEPLEGRRLLAVIPVDPPGQTISTATFTQATPAAIPTGPAVVTSTLVVAGAGSYLLDVNLTTFLAHTFPGDLDVTLTSPAGTSITITTDNGGTNDDVFNGTVWDDGANPAGQVPYVNNDGLVSDQVYAVGVVVPTLTPEEALGAFVGEDPNGTWTLTVSDDLAEDGGSLDSWSLELSTLAAPPATENFNFTNSTPTPLVDNGVTTSTLVVAGAGSYLFDLNLQTFLAHSFSSDLDVTITSPAGTVVTLTTDNAASNDDVFNGTVWDDSSNPGGTAPFAANLFDGFAHNGVYVDGVPEPTLIPEEPLAAFIGEDPNGTWTITVSDDTPVDTGTLNSWTLALVTSPPPRDFGDAPDPTYPTLQASDGARHTVGALYFGLSVDADADGQPTASADGDDSAAVDDENGITLSPTLIAQAAAQITINASAAGLVDAWIDFDRDGTWEPSEQIATSLAVVAGNNTLQINVPASAVAGVTYARFRISSAGGLAPTGSAPDGEVEDYQVTIATPGPQTATLLPDPLAPGGTVLFVNGNNNSEAIIVQPVPGNPGQVRVAFPGLILGPFAATAFTRIEIRALGGSDSIAVDAAITVPAHIYGGDGNDSVVGGSGNDIIYGEAGIDSLAGGAGHDVIHGGIDVDYLYGGLGNDLLIGGLGSDWMYGQEGDDIMIGGQTIHDTNIAALNAIMAQWSSAAAFNARVTAVSTFLNAGTISLNDGVDYLTGGTGRDWMLDASLTDMFLDFNANAATGDRKN